MDEMDLDDLIQATGLAVTLIGSLLEAPPRTLARGEFGRHLENLAAVTQETSLSQGAILQRWGRLAATASRARSN